jgi:hypothetical protein
MENFLSNYKLVTFTQEMIDFMNEFIFKVETLKIKIRQFDFKKQIIKKPIFGPLKTVTIDMTIEESDQWMAEQEPDTSVLNQFFHWENSYYFKESYHKYTRLRNLMNTIGSDWTAFLDDETYQLFLRVCNRMERLGVHQTSLCKLMYDTGWRTEFWPEGLTWIAQNDTYGQYKAVYAFNLKPEYRGGHGCHFKSKDDNIEPKMIARLERRSWDYKLPVSLKEFQEYENTQRESGNTRQEAEEVVRTDGGVDCAARERVDSVI